MFFDHLLHITGRAAHKKHRASSCTADMRFLEGSDRAAQTIWASMQGQSVQVKLDDPLITTGSQVRYVLVPGVGRRLSGKGYHK